MSKPGARWKKGDEVFLAVSGADGEVVVRRDRVTAVYPDDPFPVRISGPVGGYGGVSHCYGHKTALDAIQALKEALDEELKNARARVGQIEAKLGGVGRALEKLQKKKR